MEIITKAARMRVVSGKLWEEDRSIGFVPTMGSLHEGHLSMVREASRMADAVVVSIFIDPAQFRSEKEFEQCTRDLARDADQLAPIGVDYVFAPSYDEMYPPGFATYVEVEGLSDKLEGLARPGYFRSVKRTAWPVRRGTAAFRVKNDSPRPCSIAPCAWLKRCSMTANGTPRASSKPCGRSLKESRWRASITSP